MGEALKRRRAEIWTTSMYHPYANLVERQNQELNQDVRTLLVDKPHHLWYVSIQYREN